MNDKGNLILKTQVIIKVTNSLYFLRSILIYTNLLLHKLLLNFSILLWLPKVSNQSNNKNINSFHISIFAELKIIRSTPPPILHLDLMIDKKILIEHLYLQGSKYS